MSRTIASRSHTPLGPSQSAGDEGGTRGRTRPRAGTCASPPSARARGSSGCRAIGPTAPARRPSARRENPSSDSICGETYANGEPGLPTGPHTTTGRDPVRPGSGSGDRRDRSPPAYAPRVSLTGSTVTPPALRPTSRTPWELCSLLECAREVGDQPADCDVLPRPWWRRNARIPVDRAVVAKLAREQRAQPAALQGDSPTDDGELGGCRRRVKRWQGLWPSPGAGARSGATATIEPGVRRRAWPRARCGRGRRSR